MANNKFIYLTSLLCVALLSIALGYQMHGSNNLQDNLYYKPPVTTSIKNAEGLANQNISYTPFYSHIYYKNGKPILLEGTLSIRNTDISKSLNISQVNYYNSQGKLLKSFAEQPYELKPLESIEYLIEKEDIEGGVGANFLIYWSSDNPKSTPIIESILIGKVLDKPFAFTSRGITLYQ
jgi:hypothetical protein